MYLAAPNNGYYRPTLKVSQGRAELVIPVRREFFHAAGAVHGSVYFKALDDSAYFAASSLVFDVFLLTASFQVHFLRPIAAGEIHARAEVVHHSRRLLIADSVLTDAEGRAIARGTGTFMPGDFPLSPDIGYR
ncbi:MAG: PaaI family thioesterase [Caldilineae bacterium]|nr:MAG: PaaI family thioesterase [Caldilineae bacterium]